MPNSQETSYVYMARYVKKTLPLSLSSLIRNTHNLSVFFRVIISRCFDPGSVIKLTSAAARVSYAILARVRACLLRVCASPLIPINNRHSCAMFSLHPHHLYKRRRGARLLPDCGKESLGDSEGRGKK